MSTENTNLEYYGAFWNENMIHYLSKSAGARWFAYLLGNLLHDIDPESVLSIADVGCGVGQKTAQLAEHFPKASVVGYDFSEPATQVASNYYKELLNLSFACDDITKVSDEQRFDMIAAFDVLEHIDDWKGLASRLIEINHRYVLLSVPVGRMRPYEVNIGHFRNFQRGELETFMADSGYRTVKTFYAGFPFYSPILRDLTNRFFKTYSEIPQSEMSRIGKVGHDVWYVLFRYLSLRQRGDNFLGLFEKSV